MEKHISRIDKWLWAVRIFKTRAQSTSACARGKVKIDDNTVKASCKIQANDIIQVRKGIIQYKYKVRKVAEKRMGAKLVSIFMEDITPNEELAKLKSVDTQQIHTRLKGQGRPTKRERRIMDKSRNKF